MAGSEEQEMKLIIDIPEEEYEEIINSEDCGLHTLTRAIAHSTPLPKGIDELSKMPPMVISTAYLHAINYTLYGEDVTEKWVTATQNTCALEKAYRKGYYDAMQRQAESEK